MMQFSLKIDRKITFACQNCNSWNFRIFQHLIYHFTNNFWNFRLMWVEVFWVCCWNYTEKENYIKILQRHPNFSKTQYVMKQSRRKLARAQGFINIQLINYFHYTRNTFEKILQAFLIDVVVTCEGIFIDIKWSVPPPRLQDGLKFILFDKRKYC